MDSKNTYRSDKALVNLSLIGLVLTHIVGKTWIRGIPYSADWYLSNLIDTAVRPFLPVLLMALGAMAQREHQKGEDSFYKKVIWFAPFLIASAIYIFIYGRYDKQPFDFEIAGMLYTAAYPFYWVPLAIIYWLAASLSLWLNSRKSGARFLSAFMAFWFVFSVAIPSVYSYSIGYLNPHGILKYVTDTVNSLMSFKLAGFFFITLLYSEDLRKAVDSKKSALLRGLTSPYALLALYAIAFSIPVIEVKYEINPFDHSLRDYTRLFQALLAFGLYLKLAYTASVKMKKAYEFLVRHGSIITGLFLTHSALIEIFAAWVPPAPITGLLMKTAALMILGILCGVVYQLCERALFSETW